MSDNEKSQISEGVLSSFVRLGVNEHFIKKYTEVMSFYLPGRYVTLSYKSLLNEFIVTFIVFSSETQSVEDCLFSKHGPKTDNQELFFKLFEKSNVFHMSITGTIQESTEYIVACPAPKPKYYSRLIDSPFYSYLKKISTSVI